MMSYDPQRKIQESILLSPNSEPPLCIITPKASIKYRIAKVLETPFNKGNKIFAITVSYQTVLSSKSIYKFKLSSVTEIIDDHKPLSVWSLKLISDREVTELEKMLNEAIKRKDISFDEPVKLEINSYLVGSQLKIELDRFLSE